MKGFIYIACYRELLFFHFYIFLHEEFSRVKKKCVCQNIWTSFEFLFCREQKWAFSSIISSHVARIFSWEMMDWLGKKDEVEDEKKGKIQNNTWQYDCVFWGRMMEELMEKRRAGFGLRLDLMYRLETLLGNVAYLLLYD